MKNLNEMTSKELKEMAKGLRISNWWNLKKVVLIKKIEEVNALLEEDPEEAKQQAWENERKENPEADSKEFSNEWDNEHPREEAPEKPKKTVKAKAKPVFDGSTPKRGALIEYDGKSQNICAWAKELGISANTLYGRIYKMGWSVERAFTTPGKKGGKK